jgi:hypothetical protein
MQLKIENDRAYELASEIAKMTGEDLATAVIRALEDRLARERNRRSVEDRVAAVMAIVRAAGGSRGASSDHDELLYDEHGLPREG